MTVHQITLGFRNVGNYTIMIGAMTSDAGAFADAPTVMMSKFEAEAFDSDKFRLNIAKETYVPKNSYGETFEKECLCEMAIQEVWKGFKSFTPNMFGGSLAMLDSLYLPGEDKTKINRKIILGVFETKDNPLKIEDHAIFHGEMRSENDELVAFAMARDTDLSKTEKFRGDSLLGILRQLIFKTDNGTEFQISSDMPLKSRQVHAAAFNEMAQKGTLTKETKAALREQWLQTHEYDTDYIEFVVGMAKKTNLVFERHNRLLTLDESKELSRLMNELLKEQMGA